MRLNFQICVALSFLIVAVACKSDAEKSAKESVSPDCHRYYPAASKQTFDGRVGGLVFRNASSRPVELKLYHPDGDGSVELGWTVPANTTADLGNGFGNDWGIRADTSCVTTLGRAGIWDSLRFVIAWRADSLVAGEPADARGPLVPADSLRSNI